MKISSSFNYINKIQQRNFNKSKIQTQTNNISNDKVSFKSIFVEDTVDLGTVKESEFPVKFLKKDSLLLNEIAQDYPNQDCFIRKGWAHHPRLEYREKPPEVQIFSESFFTPYTTQIDPKDELYPCEPLIIYPDDDINMYIGMPSFISLNPSLPFTVKAGYEVHKKLLEKKYQIMDVIGKTDEIDLGEESITKKAHKAIEDVEVAVTRYLLECSLAALKDKASAEQIYASNYPKVQSRLDAKRTLDLLTSVAKQPRINPDDIKTNKVDICELATKNYPNLEENKQRIEDIKLFMTQNKLKIQ